ncbi:MAG: hypothetical protein ACKO6D_00985, partial [Rubrivivax sp.]
MHTTRPLTFPSRRRTLGSLLGGLALAGLGASALAQAGAQPGGPSGNPGAPSAAPAQAGARTIRLVVPYPPGGPLDVVARALAERVKDSLGTVVVEN